VSFVHIVRRQPSHALFFSLPRFFFLFCLLRSLISLLRPLLLFCLLIVKSGFVIRSEMPKNKGKGGKNRKRGKNEAEDEKRELVFKEDGQEYAQVLRMLGNGRCEALCIDGTKRLCHIRGKMHKKVWIASGDIILVGLRDYQDDKADVILKYQPDEARLLKAYGELPENVRLNEGIAGGMDEEADGGGDDYIEFEDEDIDRI
jgi:translation initiation factor 1A